MIDVKQQFLGAWKLISYEYRTEGGEIRYPFGEDSIGVIMYDNSGYMSVQIMTADRPAFASGDQFGGTDIEVRTAFEGLNSYFGRFEIDEDTGVVKHHLAGASLPNRIGSTQVREYQFEKNRLILKATPRILNGEMLTGVLIWEKII